MAANSPFTPEQVKELEKELDITRVKQRPGGGGNSLSYLEGYDIIDTANRIIGFGNWGYDLVANELVGIPNQAGEITGYYYAARVRLRVAGCEPITDEGMGIVSGGITGHEVARKGAITDGLKRCFRCFGEQFGNSLYDKDEVKAIQQEQKQAGNRPAPQQGRQTAPTPIRQNSQPPAPAPAPAQPKTSSLPGALVREITDHSCPNCFSPLEERKGKGPDGTYWLGEFCIGKGCGYKKNLAGKAV